MAGFLEGLGTSVGGLLQAGMNMFNYNDQKKFAVDQAAAQMAFQERMASSAYQRTMRDMEKAGLNPILAYQKGPTSSPTGALASTPSTPNIPNAIGEGISTAMQASRLDQELQNMKATNENLHAQNALIKADTAKSISSATQMAAQTKLIAEQTGIAEKGADVADFDKWFYGTTFGKVMRTLGLTGGELGNFLKGAPRPHIIVRPQD